MCSLQEAEGGSTDNTHHADTVLHSTCEFYKKYTKNNINMCFVPLQLYTVL